MKTAPIVAPYEKIRPSATVERRIHRAPRGGRA